jgi:hypothetical protein
MTTADHSRPTGARPEPGPDADLVHGQQLPLQSDQDYRQLEQHYRRSAQYAAMVSRYPLLRHWIDACRHSELVADPLPGSQHQGQPGIVLQWDRSHGEG